MTNVIDNAKSWMRMAGYYLLAFVVGTVAMFSILAILMGVIYAIVYCIKSGEEIFLAVGDGAAHSTVDLSVYALIALLILIVAGLCTAAGLGIIDDVNRYLKNRRAAKEVR